MKHWIACLSLLSLMFLTACDTVNHTQLQVGAPKGEEKTRMTVPEAERETVKQVLKDLATRHHYEDRTTNSLTPDTLASYAQPDVKYPISIRAWVSHERVVIDVVQRRPDVAGESIAYSKVRTELEEELDKHFGNRLTLVGKTRQAESRVIPPKQLPPPSPQ